MSSNNLLHVLIAFALLFSSTTSYLDAPDTSSSSAPETGADDSPSFPSPSPSPSVNFPYMSPPADLAPTLASSPSLAMSPAPEPEKASDTTTANVESNTTTANVESDKPKDSESRGLSGGAKAGIAIGVIAAACAVGFGGMLYKKRKENIHRARLAFAARGDLI